MNYGKNSVQKKKKALRSKSKRWWRKLILVCMKIFLICFIGVAIVGVSAGLGIFKGIIDSAPVIDLGDTMPRGFSTFIYNSQGQQTAKLIAEDSNRVPVTMDQIPQDLADAFVAVEDERFYEHNGIDIKGIIRAGVKAITTFDLSEGASTITQQLIKNNVLVTWTQEKSDLERIKRKVQEQYLAIQLEKTTSKEEILEAYMNTINLGQGCLGVQTAAKRYFNKNVWELNLSECTVIAGITKAPTRYNPITNPDKNAERRVNILNKMLDQGYISKAEYDEAVADDVYSRIQLINQTTEATTINSYYDDAVINQVLEDLVALGKSETEAHSLLYSGGLSIFSAQDPDIQAICDEVCLNEENYPENTKWLLSYRLSIQRADESVEHFSSEMLKEYIRETKDSSFNLLYKNKEDAYADIQAFKEATLAVADEELAETITLTPQPQISLTIADQSTGYVVAMVGGRGSKEGNRTLNRATDSARQPGSTFKVVSAYAPALDSYGMTLADVQVDAPYNYDSGKPVSNWYNDGYRGICSLRDGIRDSLNIIAVKTLTQITPKLGYDYLLNFGFTTLVESKEINGKIYSDINQTLALGGITNGVKNIELNAAYASIANNGVYIEPKLYTKVIDHDGNVLLDNTATESRQIIKDTTAYLLTDAMVDVVRSGTGTAVNFDSNMPIAGKTGTTSDYNDVWFSGYTPYYTCTTWTGYDNNTKLSGSQEKALAKTIWRAVMSRIHEGLESKPFNKPANLVTQQVCSQSGKLPIIGLCDAVEGNIKTEYFTPETVPTETCDVHYQGLMCQYSLLPASAECPFKTTGILTMSPENEKIITGQVNEDGTAVLICPHNAEFYADPNAQAVIDQQQLELNLRNDQGQYEQLMISLQTSLQEVMNIKQNAEAQLAAAATEDERNIAQQTINDAQSKIDSLSAQILQLQTAQANVAAQAAALTGSTVTPAEGTAAPAEGAAPPAEGEAAPAG